jgi:hypothetical protein
MAAATTVPVVSSITKAAAHNAAAYTSRPGHPLPMTLGVIWPKYQIPGQPSAGRSATRQGCAGHAGGHKDVNGGFGSLVYGVKATEA